MEGKPIKPERNNFMYVLVACEESQRVCIAFRKKGHIAYSCDIMDESGGHPEWHIKSDVVPLLNGNCFFKTNDGLEHQLIGKWDMIIAFPPCTYLTNTQNWCYNVDKFGYEKVNERKKERKKALEFVITIYNSNCDKICIENPIGYINNHYMKPTQIIQPWFFGDNFTKTTCLWLKGLEPLNPLIKNKPFNCSSYAYDNLYDENGKILAWNSKEIKILRSKTFQGVANAMAEQWG